MSQIQTNHVTYVFVPSDIDRTATTIIDPASATYIKEGEVVLCGVDNALVTNSAATYTGIDRMQIAMRKESGLFKSPVFSASNVSMYKVNTYSAATNKVTYIGYNGTSGDLEDGVFTGATEYDIDVRKLALLDHGADDTNFHKNFGYYNTSASATQCQVACGLVKNGVANFNDEYQADTFITIEMVSGAVSNAASLAGSFVENSNVVVFTGAGHGVSAGSILRPGGATKTNGTYLVESVDGANVYLDVPFQSTSCTCTPHILTSPAVADFGIKITGNPKKFDSGNNKFRFDVSDFKLTLRGFNDTDITYSTKANLGIGDWREVAQLEWEAQDMEGQTSHSDYLMPTRKRYFEEDNTYDVLVINAYDDSFSTLAGTPKSLFTFIVPIATASEQGDNAGADPVASGLAVALDNWLTANTSKTYTEVSNLT